MLLVCSYNYDKCLVDMCSHFDVPCMLLTSFCIICTSLLQIMSDNEEEITLAEALAWEAHNKDDRIDEEDEIPNEQVPHNDIGFR